MNNEITLDREFIESVVVELEEAFDLMCPCPATLPITESICNSCRFKDICERMHKAVLALTYTL